MKNPVFRGTCTALITPFSPNGIRYDVLDQLLERQIEAGVEAVVLCGTTGEAATMRAEEQLEVIRHGVQTVHGRMTVIAGTGSNDTARAAAQSRAAEEAGADAVLVVTPYYNKATEQGLIAHYTAVAAAVRCPVIAYNVPSRTGVNMTLSVYEALSEIPNLNGVKEASGDLAKAERTIGRLGGNFYVWSGSDELTVPILSVGGQGVVSVLSNVTPGGVRDMVRAAQGGDYRTAGELQCAFLPLIDALFSEVNPIPVKAAMNLLGFDAGAPRLPLTAASPATRERLRRLLRIRA